MFLQITFYLRKQESWACHHWISLVKPVRMVYLMFFGIFDVFGGEVTYGDLVTWPDMTGGQNSHTRCAMNVRLGRWKNGGAQRRRFFTYLTGHSLRTLGVSFDLRSCQVRSQGQVKWPHLKKSFRSCSGQSFNLINLRLTDVYEGDDRHILYISGFWPRWPKVRSIL
jgi:hypothetical protein